MGPHTAADGAGPRITLPRQKPSGVGPWQASQRLAASRSGQGGCTERARGNARDSTYPRFSGGGKGLKGQLWVILGTSSESRSETTHLWATK